MMYVYKHTEHSADHDLFTVGYYDPSGQWFPESDHNDRGDAVERVVLLNGGDASSGKILILMERQQKELMKLRETVTDLTRALMELNKQINKIKK